MKRSALIAMCASLVGVAGCGGGGGEPTVYSSGENGPAHVHGLAVVDGQVLAAAHNGLWKVGGGRAARVGSVRDDLMGFTDAGGSRFLASGHPAAPGSGPPHLGLIESMDGGRSWANVSLPGQADFHALAASGRTVYGYDAGQLLVSRDGGKGWREDRIGTDVVSLAMRAGDERRVLAGTAEGVKLRTAGGRWKTILPKQPALVSWPSASKIVAVALDGQISVSTDTGDTWQKSGTAPGAPVAAFSDARTLVVASEDGSIARSTDAGATWTPLLAATEDRRRLPTL